MKSNGKKSKKRGDNGELEHGAFLSLSWWDIEPSPENDELYGPIDPDDPEIVELARSIAKFGLKEPIVITADNFILSGHRRHAACEQAELWQVPCRIVPSIRRSDCSKDEYLAHLREFNRQRVKSRDVVARESVIDADPEETYRSIQKHRRQRSRVKTEAIQIDGFKRRATITPAKKPFLDAIQFVLEDRKEFWPLTDRMIHYALLNDPPLIHASKPNSRYNNTKQSYKALCELVARARFEREIPFEAIHDPTRPVTIWQVHESTASFLRNELGGLLKGYYRNLQQSQPNHIEIVGEKNTIESIIEPVAMQYCIPLTIGRGYASLSPRHGMADRFKRSGKDKLVIIFVTDFDPEGEDIAHSFARSMRDDFDIENVVPIKAALTAEQVDLFNLPPQMKAKAGSSRRDKFVEQHGDDVFELEALPPEDLQAILRETIDSVLDLPTFNAEIDEEKKDVAHLDKMRRRVHHNIGDLMEDGN
jgi:hypothetical protein